MCVVFNFHMVDLWISYNNIRVSLVLFHFGLGISECSGHWQTTWNYSDRSLGNWTTWSCKHDVVVLVNLPASFKDSFPFCLFAWLVILGQRDVLQTLLATHHCSRVSSVGNPHIIIDYKHNNSTRARFVLDGDLVLAHKSFFCFFETKHQCFLRVQRKRRLARNNIMQVISQKLSAAMSSMSIKYCEKRSLSDSWCKRFVRFWTWLLKV